MSYMNKQVTFGTEILIIQMEPKLIVDLRGAEVVATDEPGKITRF